MNTKVLRLINRELIRKKLHRNRNILLALYETGKSMLKSSPKPLFINGKFNSNNWASGDGKPLRHIINKIDCERPITVEVSARSDTYVTLVAAHTRDYYYDNNYYDFIVRHIDGDKPFIVNNYYTVKIYKDRGSIESIICNGHEITEEEYITLIQYFASYYPMIDYFKLPNIMR